MVPHGGSATVYGILYQILGSLEWALTIRLQDAKIENGDLLDARLILEPTGGGGDLRIEGSRGRIVEQWKSRRTQRRWNLSDMVNEVLPDLYLAVDWPPKHEYESFRFVSESERTGLQTTLDFFRELTGTPEDPLAFLDGSTIVHFSRGWALSKRELFSRIVDSVRKRPDVSEHEDEPTTRRKLWHLLGRFSLRSGGPLDDVRRGIDEALLPRVDILDNIASKREELCGWIMDQIAGQEAAFTIRELLQATRLDVLSLWDRSTIGKALRPLLERGVARSGYRQIEDVRQAPAWPTDRSTLVLSGESGQGKTWQMARLALGLAAAGELVVWVPSRRNAREDLQSAADVFWKEGCRHELPLEVADLARRWQRVHRNGASRHWLTICLDDVQDAGETSELLSMDLEALGLRLALTAPPVIARRLPQEVSVVEVPPFTLSELAQYLERKGRSVAPIPPDVLKTLRLPLLARIYCEMSGDPGWSPTNEYDLYERFWRRIEEARNQLDHPQDASRLRRLARMLLDPDRPYPWTGDELLAAGMDDAAQRRLEAIGWLRRLDRGLVEVTHDRLLNWAVAEFLFDQWDVGRMPIEDLAAQLIFCNNALDNRLKRHLGYVMMDVLWNLSRRSTQGFVDLLLTIENRNEYVNLYESLLPTLGERAVEGLIERVRRLDAREENSFLPEWIVECLLECMENAGSPSWESPIGWLQDSHPYVQEVGARVFAQFPSADALDPLWNLHTANTAEHEARRDLDVYLRFFNTFKALRACIRKSPTWLESKLHSAPTGLEASELVRLLAECDGAGREIWMRWKIDLFTRIPLGKRPVLISCIGAFRDLEELPRLEEWLGGDLDIRIPALREMAWLAPDRALALLPQLPPEEVFPFAPSWLPTLLFFRPEPTRELLRNLMARDASAFWLIARAYQGFEGDLDGVTVRLCLDRLGADAATLRANGGENPQSILQKRLVPISQIQRLDLLREFETRAGTQLEEDLAALASSWVQRFESSRDWELEQIRMVLLKIAGEGFSRLVEAGIRQAPHYAKVEAIDWACLDGSESVIDALWEVVEAKGSGNRFELERRHALTSLAALGQEDRVISAMLRYGRKAVLASVKRCRQRMPAMSDANLARAIEAVRSEDREVRLRGLAALSITGREEALALVPDFLERALEPEEREAVLLLVEHLVGGNSEAARQLADRVEIARFPNLASTILFRIGTEEALDQIESYIYASSSLSLEVANLAASLARRRGGKGRAAELVWEYLKQQRRPWRAAPFIEAVAGLDLPEVREMLLAEAIQATDHYHPGVDLPIAAIRGLARFDPARAFEAAAQAFHDLDPANVDIPMLLVELDPERSIVWLVEQALRESRTWRLWNIGRALRKGVDAPQLSERLAELLRDSDPALRARAAHLCGWLSPSYLSEDLDRLIAEDSVDEVQRSCLDARRRQRKHGQVLDLLREIERASGLRRWSYLHAAIQIGDPLLLSRRTDPLCLWPVLDHFEGVFSLYAERWLNERLKELKKEAENIDSNQRWR